LILEEGVRSGIDVAVVDTDVESVDVVIQNLGLVGRKARRGIGDTGETGVTRIAGGFAGLLDDGNFLEAWLHQPSYDDPPALQAGDQL
jgi:hypothetical protein